MYFVLLLIKYIVGFLCDGARKWKQVHLHNTHSSIECVVQTNTRVNSMRDDFCLYRLSLDRFPTTRLLLNHPAADGGHPSLNHQRPSGSPSRAGRWTRGPTLRHYLTNKHVRSSDVAHRIRTLSTKNALASTWQKKSTVANFNMSAREFAGQFTNGYPFDENLIRFAR